MKLLKKALDSLRYRLKSESARRRLCGVFGNKIKKQTVLVGVPDYDNIGDMAIALAELKLFERIGVSCGGFSTRECFDLGDCLHRLIPNRTLICYQGGGNIGNVWPNDERIRRTMLEGFCDNPSIVLPQTAYFTPDGDGEDGKRVTVEKYGKNRHLTVALRDRTSYELSEELFPHAKRLFCPDIVLSTRASDYGVEKNDRSGVLLCLRGDLEGKLDGEVSGVLGQALDERGITYRCTDNIYRGKKKIVQRNLGSIVKEKLTEISSSSLVVTDRLHGMIFCAISGTPCIVLGNFNHKVRQTYDIISYLPYIRFAENVQEAASLIDDLYGMEGNYDNEPLMPYYRELEAEILRKLEKQ